MLRSLKHTEEKQYWRDQLTLFLVVERRNAFKMKQERSRIDMKKIFLIQKIASQITKRKSKSQRGDWRKVMGRCTTAPWDFLFSSVSLIWKAIEKPSFDNNICVTSSNSNLTDLLNQRTYLRVDHVVLVKVCIVQNLQIKRQFY